MVIATWGMQTNRDAGMYWVGLFHSGAIGSSNWARMNDSVFEPILNKAQITVNAKERAALLQQAWDRLYEVHPIVPLAIADEIYGGRKDLVGMEDFADGQLNYLGDLYIQE